MDASHCERQHADKSLLPGMWDELVLVTGSQAGSLRRGRGVSGYAATGTNNDHLDDGEARLGQLPTGLATASECDPTIGFSHVRQGLHEHGSRTVDVKWVEGPADQAFLVR